MQALACHRAFWMGGLVIGSVLVVVVVVALGVGALLAREWK